MKTTANRFNDARNSANHFMSLTSYNVGKNCATKLAEHSTEYQMMAVFGWQNANEARPYIEAANRLRQAAIAMKQERVGQLDGGAMVNYLKKSS